MNSIRRQQDDLVSMRISTVLSTRNDDSSKRGFKSTDLKLNPQWFYIGECIRKCLVFSEVFEAKIILKLTLK